MTYVSVTIKKKDDEKTEVIWPCEKNKRAYTVPRKQWDCPSRTPKILKNQRKKNRASTDGHEVKTHCEKKSFGKIHIVYENNYKCCKKLAININTKNSF